MFLLSAKLQHNMPQLMAPCPGSKQAFSLPSLPPSLLKNLIELILQTLDLGKFSIKIKDLVGF